MGGFFKLQRQDQRRVVLLRLKGFDLQVGFVIKGRNQFKNFSRISRIFKFFVARAPE